MPFKVVREEPDFFIAEGDGGELKIAKKALSPSRVEKYRGYCKGGEVEPAKMAKGGEVPAYKIANETESEFEIEDGQGRFRVAKKGLSSQTLEKIKGYAAGGVIPELDYLGAMDAEERQRQIDAEIAALHQTPPFPGSEPVSLAPEAPVPISEPEAVPVQGGIREALSSWAIGQTGNAPAQPSDPVPQVQGEPEAVPVTDRTPFGVPVAAAAEPPATPATKGTPDLLQAPPPEAPAGLSALPPPPPVPAVTGSAGTGTAAAYDAAMKQQAAAVMEVGEIEKRAAEALQQAHERGQQHMVEVAERGQKQLAEWQASGDELYAGFMNHQIKPDRVWSEASTPRKLSAVLGLIIGGIGSGLTRQPNAALQVINGIIDRDIDAQKAELGKKQNRIAMHMESGRNLKDAIALARADAASAAAGFITGVNLTFAGEKAQAEREALAAQLKATAAVDRQQIIANDEQIEAARITKSLKLYELQTMQRLQALREAYQRNPSQFSDADALRVMGVPEAEILEVGPRAYRAKSEGSANEARKSLIPVMKAEATIANLKALAAKPASSISPADRTTANAYAQSLVGMLREPFLGPGVMDKRERAILESIARNPTKIFSLDSANMASLDAILTILDNEKTSTLSNYTVGGGKIRPLSPGGLSVPLAGR